MRYSVLVSALFIAATSAQAGVIIGGTRLVYHGEKKEASLSLSNTDAINYLIQSTVETTSGTKAPFLVTPPLFRLNAHQENVLRVVQTESGLPQDRESLYWLNVKSIPSSARQEGVNTLQIAIRTRIKLLYRPAAVTGKPDAVADKLSWHKEGNTLIVTNPTPFYMNFQSVAINGKKIEKINYAAPEGDTRFDIPPEVNGNTLSWNILNDYGAPGKEFKQNL